ncbi:hypothetical protein [Agrobacterium tumefaciens]|uniref:hypothetical protein n=1 Tax=Agrobacterium tumefaciens TaxID=358 RepID=UPI001573E2A3|nr:hypothetical protein [Agrobacterium tumefaciens]
MKFPISHFAGEIPRTIPRLLPDGFAQVAINCKLEDGSLTPIRIGRLEHTAGFVPQTIFLQGENWLTWDIPLDIVPGPVASDRLYITGEGAPKMRVGDTVRSLALSSPITPLVVQVIGQGNDTSTTVLYTYTWVTDLDEESEPAPVSNEMTFNEGGYVYIVGFGVPPATRGVNRLRLYRSQTSALGSTVFYFIKELPVVDGVPPTEYLDRADSFVEPLPSLDYNPPPDTLRGLIALPNGMMAAFSGKGLYFCEPYIPHAWPEKYVLTTDYEIVGLGAFGSSIAVLTKGQPYVVTGSAPENMTMEKLELNLPCINKRGIVDLGYAVAYPTHGGLVTISTSGAQVATEGLFTRDQWLKMNPYSFVASQFSGRYMASYAYSDDEGMAQKGIIIIDLTGARPFVSRSSDFANAMFYQIETGLLYVANDRQVFEWDALSQPYSEMTWISKRLMLPTYTNFGALLVEAEDVLTADQRKGIEAKNVEIRAKNRVLIDSGAFNGQLGAIEMSALPLAGSLLQPIIDYVPTVGVTVIADGKEVGFVSEANDVARLPSGFLSKVWEIAVRGNTQVTALVLASTPTDIAES